ncbi:MAG: family 20 glycosylhydrolase, partial [Terracidiphilus sp.]|nr:family 20 glycosylhydrolase [Terracidiphilus sp.]
DWPAMKYRGLSDDLSRGPIATLAFQKHEVQVLSEYKMNIYSPYFEVSLEYASSPLIAPPGGAMTKADVAELVSYARKFHVTIVPEQESFGHLHRALMFQETTPLAETPLGSALAPGQAGSIQLDKQWFGEIATMFPGPFIHIGADEVFELGTGQSKQLVAQNGGTQTYIAFFKQIHDALQPLHRKLIFWNDYTMDPALVKTMPKDMIAVAWEYGPHPEGFSRWLSPFVDAGMETWVSPGINNWNRIYPNNYEGLLCIQGFVAEGQRVGSTGMLNTVWNTDEDDEGLIDNDWYGVLFGAAASWQAGTSSIPQFESTYGQVFHGDRTGKINQAQRELTAAQLSFRKGGSLHGAMTNLFWTDPWSEQGQIVSAKLMPMVPEIRLHAERAITLLKQAEAAEPLRERGALDAMELAARRMDFIGYKFQAAQEIAGAYNQAYREKNGKRSVGSPLFHEDYFYIDMVDGYGLLRDLHEQAWKQQNRPYTLDIVMAHYDMNIQLWLKREALFADAKSHFNRTQALPRPEDVDIPTLAPEAGLPGKR